MPPSLRNKLKNFICGECSGTFSSQNSLNSHQRVHKGIGDGNMILGAVAAGEKAFMAASDVRQYANYFQMLLSFVTYRPCASILLAIITYSITLVSYGWILKYVPFLNTNGALAGLGWSEVSMHQVYLKKNVLPAADYATIFGGLPITATTETGFTSWFTCKKDEETCNAAIQKRYKEMVKHVQIMKELLNVDWESMGYTEAQACAMVWTMPVYQPDSSFKSGKIDKVKLLSALYPEYFTALASESDLEDIEKSYKASWGIKQMLPFQMFSAYQRILGSWLSKNGTAEVTRKKTHEVLDFIELQHLPFVRWITTNKQVVADANIKFVGLYINRWLTYASFLDTQKALYKDKGLRQNIEIYRDFVQTFSTSTYFANFNAHDVNIDVNTEELKSLKETA